MNQIKPFLSGFKQGNAHCNIFMENHRDIFRGDRLIGSFPERRFGVLSSRPLDDMLREIGYVHNLGFDGMQDAVQELAQRFPGEVILFQFSEFTIHEVSR